MYDMTTDGIVGVDGKVAATIPLGGKPEAGVSDPAAGRVYVNNESGNSIVVIDTAKHEVVANWPIAPGTTRRAWRSI
jgi:YVTN family beta-propeller protein